MPPTVDEHATTGSLTDVSGVLVGHHQRTGRGWQTGTTVVHVPAGAVAAVDVRGGGPGTRETDALDPGNLVDRVHAVCLSGGSAYGLATADGVMAELERRRLGVPVGPNPDHVVPVVPTAGVFDLGRGGGFGHRPEPTFGERALRAAKQATRRGAVGAGTGAVAGGLQGGVGMASAQVELERGVITVAALAVVNAAGSPIDRTTGAPWIMHPALRRPSAADRRRLIDTLDTIEARRLAPDTPPTPSPLNTTIGVVATDAAVSRPEAQRLALAAHDGLARAIRPAHGLTDGDTIFALATGAGPLPTDDVGLVRAATSRAVHLNRLCAAAAEVFGIACVDAIARASAIGAAPAYAELCPSALRP